MASLSDLKKYIPVPVAVPSGGGGGGGSGVGSILKIVLAFVVIIGMAIGGLAAAGSPVASAWSTKITSAMQNTGVGAAILGVTSSISTAAGDFTHSLTVNPWEETTATEQKTTTETKAAAGFEFVAEDLKSPGILLLPSQPRSGENLIIRVGVYNPTKDFVADQAYVYIENSEEIKSKTGLEFLALSPVFAPLAWIRCDQAGLYESCNIQPKEYSVAEIVSTNAAKEIAEDKITETAVNMRIGLDYYFASTRSVTSGPFAGQHMMPMNEFTFTIRPETTVASELDAWEKSLIQRKAGGIADVNLDNRAGLDWDSTAYFDYSIKNMGSSASLTEEIFFVKDLVSKQTTEDKVIIAIPSGFALLNTDKYTSKGSDDDYNYYSANDRTIFPSKLNENRTIKEMDKASMGLKIKTPAKATELVGKQYTVSVYFLDGAYAFRGMGLKDTAVKP